MKVLVMKIPATKIISIGVFFCGMGMLLFSCAGTPNPFKEIDYAVSVNDFQGGIETIRQKQGGNLPVYSEKNAISLFIDKGLLEHYAGNYRTSSQDLEEAERLIEEAFTKSITAEIASYIANDNTKDYPGEDYEDIYINVFNALNYFHANDLEGAMVEIRKITMSSGKLDLLSRKYENAHGSVGDWVMQQLRSLGLQVNPNLPQGNPVNFSNSALARYLGALFYLGQGNRDGARIEFEQLKAAYDGNKKIYSNPIPKSAADAQDVPPGLARLNIIGFAGLSPVKEEKLIPGFFPFFQNASLRAVQYKLPVFAARPQTQSINRIEVEISGAQKFGLELLEDMGEVIKETYNARFSNMYFKTYIRTLVKYAAADIAATKAGEYGGSFAAYGSALAAKVTIDATEGADIRMARYFPDKAYIGGINLDPGTYPVTVTYYSGNRVIARDDPVDVTIRANQLNLIEAFCLK